MLDLKCCPICGKLSDTGDATCPHCGSVFEKERSEPDFTFQPSEPGPVQRSMASGETSRPLPAQEPETPEETSRPAPGGVPLQPSGTIRNPWIAVVLSFIFIGWGQWYNGKTWEGVRLIVYMIAAVVVFVILALALSFLNAGVLVLITLGIFILVTVLIWGYGIVEAYVIADKINRGDLVFQKKSALFWVPVLIIVFQVLVAVVFGMSGIAALHDLQAGSALPDSQAGPAVPDLPAAYSTYDNPSLGFSIRYPDSWTYEVSVEPDRPDITDVKFSSSDRSTGLLVQVADVSGTTRTASLDEWAKETLALLGSGRNGADFILTGNERTTIAGYPAQRYEFTSVMNSGREIRSVVYLTVKGSRVYNIAFVTAESQAAGTSGMQQTIFSSFVLA